MTATPGGAATSAPTLTAEDRGQAVTFAVEGMTCANCVQRVTRRLGALPGVAAASVNLATTRAEVRYIPGQTSVGEMIEAVRRLGYDVPLAESRLLVEGMTCASCVGRVERALTGLPGVVTAEVNLASGTAAVRRLAGSLEESALVSAVEKAGYRATVVSAAEPDVEEAARQRDVAAWRRRFLWAAVPTAPLLMTMVAGWLGGWPSAIGWLANPWLLMALATVVQAIPGSFFYRDAYLNLKGGSANMSVLVALGTTAAYLASVLKLVGVLPAAFHGLYFETSAVLITLVLLGKVMEATGKGRASSAIRRLASLRPPMARLVVEGEERAVPAREIRPGDLIRVRPGEALAVDGVVVEGQTAIDESLLTGESMPVTRQVRDRVSCGTHNLSGSILVRAERTGADTALAQIVRLVEQAQAGKAPAERFADRVAAWFVGAVLAIACLTALVWVVMGQPTEALVAAVAVLVVACPCALGLAIPTAIMVGTGRAAEQGMLFRNPEVLERALRVTAVVFDKTGTLTEGRPSVAAWRGYGPWQGREQVLAGLVAAVEARSEHPLAQALAEPAAPRPGQSLPVEEWWSESGLGVRALVAGQAVAVGTLDFLASLGVAVPGDWEGQAEDEAALGRTVVWVGVAGQPAGYVALADRVRPEAAGVVAELERSGKQVWLLTGDNQETALAVARQVGISEQRVKARVLPAEKAQAIAELRADGALVAMVGEGINDAPALAEADLGVALGTGTDVARAAADVTLIASDLNGVVAAFQMSQATVRKIHQNLVWALGYNTIGIPLAAIGLLNPAIAAAAMALSSVSVTSSALLLRRVRLATDRPAAVSTVTSRVA